MLGGIGGRFGVRRMLGVVSGVEWVGDGVLGGGGGRWCTGDA
jgi:hypothetical protein